MSRRLLMLMTVLLCLLPVVQQAGATESVPAVTVMVDGRPLDQGGHLVGGRTMVPLRAIFEAVGATVEWEEESRTVTATRGDDVLRLTVGSHLAEWRSSLISVDAAPTIIEGRTLVPLRFIGQALGLHVRWDGATRTAHLERSPADPALAIGTRVVHAKSCMVCHALGGAGGKVGPALDGVAGRYSEDWLRTWMRDPQAVRPGSRMPNFRLNEAEIDGVIQFLKQYEGGR